MTLWSPTPRAVLAWALTVRVALVAGGRVADALFEVRYTDVDYDVFTDGARHVAAGESPYLRHGIMSRRTPTSSAVRC